jgi:hypothetical protein
MIKFCTPDTKQITEAWIISILPLSGAGGGKLHIRQAFVISGLPTQSNALGKIENHRYHLPHICCLNWGIICKTVKNQLGRMIDYLTAPLASTSPSTRFANRQVDNQKLSIGLSTLPLLYFLPAPVLPLKGKNNDTYKTAY